MKQLSKKQQLETIKELLEDIKTAIETDGDFFFLARVPRGEEESTLVALAYADSYDIADAIAQYLTEVPEVRAAFAEQLYKSMQDEMLLRMKSPTGSTH